MIIENIKIIIVFRSVTRYYMFYINLELLYYSYLDISRFRQALFCVPGYISWYYCDNHSYILNCLIAMVWFLYVFLVNFHFYDIWLISYLHPIPYPIHVWYIE